MSRKSSMKRQESLQLLAVLTLCLCISPVLTAQHNVTIHNNFQDSSSPNTYKEADSCTYVEGSKIYSSGDTFAGLSDSSQFHTKTPTYSGVYPNAFHKFSSWDQSPADWLFTKKLYVDQNFERSSYLNVTHSAHLWASYEDEPGSFDANNPPTIKFKNPWDIRKINRYVYTQANPAVFDSLKISSGDFDLTGEEKGIFTGIHRDFDRPDIPYYSVRVPRYYAANPDSLQMWDAVFICWKHRYATDTLDAATNEEAYSYTRAFKFESDNDTSTAWYKAHLRSNISGNQHATGINSQRKIAIDPDGRYHAVYESSGDIWYITSIDTGKTWKPEIIVSNGSGSNHDPSIALHGSSPYVTFIGNDNAVFLYERTYSGWHQKWYDNVSTPGINFPVVGINNNCPGDTAAGICVVWADRQSNVNLLRYALIPTGSGSTIVDDLVASSYDQPRYPSMGSTPTSEQFGVVWQDRGKLIYTNIYVHRCHSNFWYSVAPFETVSIPSEVVYGAPSMTIADYSNDGISEVVAYEVRPIYKLPQDPIVTLSYNPLSTLSPSSRVVVRSHSVTTSPGTWRVTSQAYQWGATDYGHRKPTVGAEPDPFCSSAKSVKGIRVAFNGFTGFPDLSRIKMIQIPNPSFCGSIAVDSLDWGQDPNMVASTSVSWTLLALYCHGPEPASPMGSPATYLTHGIFATQPKALRKTTTVGLCNVRETNVWRDTAIAAYTMRNLRVRDGGGDSTSIEWDCAHDSLVIGVNATMDEKMRSETFTVPSGAQFIFGRESFVNYPGDFPTNSAFEIRFRLSSDSSILSKHGVTIASMPTDSSVYDDISIDISALVGKSIFVTLGVSTEMDTLPAVVNSVSMDEATVPKGISSRQPTLPQTITLEQNYPNPFNPSTEISFSIPEKGNVRLSVFDAFGRMVAQLVDQEKPTGRYTVPFDGRNLPSGIYFYRLTMDHSSLTRKMCLVK